ncbi:winged helix-turn-helix transcriptional regulator [Pedobacter sp. AW31-3R]|uniref:winged helix-turn-helix transcriptional regulator n=1 Tax=Pedobacter sp. AW31-3R TaxID=3445781 RepID=UPI003FA063E4
MENKTEKCSKNSNCPIRTVLDRFGDRWSMLVILVLGDSEKMRFSEIHKELGDISQKMLTSTLRTFENDGLVQRTIFPEIPPRVEYRLTDKGRSLLPHLYNLIEWATENMPLAEKAV